MKKLVTVGLFTLTLATSSTLTRAAIPPDSSHAHQATGYAVTFLQDQAVSITHSLRKETAQDIRMDQEIDWVLESGRNTSVGQDATWRPFWMAPGATGGCSQVVSGQLSVEKERRTEEKD
jgi:hypothetical protein